jgi:pyruvate kinase
MNHAVDIERTGRQLESIRSRAAEFEADYADVLNEVHPLYQRSARNLVHYLALRQVDIRELQQELAVMGLSSLERAERNVMASIQAVQGALVESPGTADTDYGALDLHNPIADRNKDAILGSCPEDRHVSIMVTMPTDAATNQAHVEEMLNAGMNVARINCARDDQEIWTGIIRNVRTASEISNKPCRIVMDLAGPKIRTGALQPGPRVVHIRPRRDPLGRIIAPRRIRLIPENVVWRGTKAAVIPIPDECIDYAQVGDVIR